MILAVEKAGEDGVEGVANRQMNEFFRIMKHTIGGYCTTTGVGWEQE